MKRFVGKFSVCTLVFLLCELLSSCFLFVQSKQHDPRRLKMAQKVQEQQSRKLNRKTVTRQGDWVITQWIDKNNFDIMDELPDCPTITVTDYDKYKDIRAELKYNGSIWINAWASDEDFDVAPRYVERYSGIKYASTHKRFERSEQAYGYTYVNYNVSKVDGKTREVLLDATKFGPMCIQDGVPEKYMNEDCLYLNLWRPSLWKQALNTTSKCRHKFIGGGLLRKDCEVITTTKTTNPDGTIVLKENFNKTSEVLSMAGNRALEEDTQLFLEYELGDKDENGNRDLQSVGDTLDNALDNLEQGLNDLKDEIEGSESEDEDVTNDERPPTLGTYNVDESGLLPVMVYIHGGGYMEGSGNDSMFDGSKVAGRGNVILVTLNYRLGIFGFLPSFGWDQWKVNGGMNGFADVVEALTWIQRNIIQWGGNPNKVTVFGPADTPTVCLLTMCPAAQGKFQRAILQTGTRETEVREGKLVTNNGVNGASCLLSSQEPYQPLEGRIEIAYKFFDFVNETFYNFPENPDPTRSDIIDWLQAFGLNSTEMWNASKWEGTVFFPNQPTASYDYNRDDDITTTQQRRTFMTWDNDLFPQLPIDLEFEANPIDILVGVRGKATDERQPPPVKKKNLPDGVAVQSASEERKADNIFVRDPDDSFTRRLQNRKQQNIPPPKSDGTGDDDYFDFYAPYHDDDTFFDYEADKTNCTKYSDYHYPRYNQTWNETECTFDFSGTTSDQELCVSKQYAEIMARNVEGHVYGYVIDDGTDLHGFHRRRLFEAHDEFNEDYWGDDPSRNVRRNLRLANGKIRQSMDYVYDLESLYFFDNFQIGNNFGWRKAEVKMQKELFNRWINFAKTGIPVVTKRTAAKAARYVSWDPFPKGEIGLDTNRLKTNRDSYTPQYLYMSAGRVGKRKPKKSRMITLEELFSHRTLWKYPKDPGSTDICSWVLDEENDYDEDFVEVLLDFNANTAFEYYVTILATLNPTINYVPDREYTVKMPPTMAPTSLADFVEKSMELEMSSSPPSTMTTGSMLFMLLIGTATMTIAQSIAFG